MITLEVFMADQVPQTYANHRRFDPIYHILGFGLLLVALVLSIVHMVRQPGLTPAWEMVATISMLITFLLFRGYALRNQDRLIRLEETRRMERLLVEPLRLRIPELSVKQLIALRFSSDEELPSLLERTLGEGLDQVAIKKSIRNWRPDTFRV